MPHHYWRIGVTPGETDIFEAMHSGGFMAIGWPKLGNLSEVIKSDNSKETLVDLIAQHHPNAKNVVSRGGGGS